ncbi:hypothetical protein Shyhy01_19700 [Streptomyces hygroscopicus subsp. hygroscopicus]|nr:hypothetical protein [Streptomyces hygroscopicus]GLX49020.1 hypothetical protein Shyhy01_19700 [Streptomyces hygroscopicus subsp. hygroscopicus]
MAVAFPACVHGCSAPFELCEVYLPGPVFGVTEVNVDGQVLPLGAYRVDAPGNFVRADGECWPDCQDMAAASGQPGTFMMTYRWGCRWTRRRSLRCPS